MNILVTGGAGYKGVKLTKKLLLKGHNVTILDNFMYGYESVLPFVSEKKCKIIQKDIRAIREVDLVGYDIVYHLAALSGYLSCDANPHSAREINSGGTKKISKFLSTDQILVYASTTSFYGNDGKKMTEENPIPKQTSLYAITKFEAEKYAMQRKNSISLRFAALFGTSGRMRNDLMVHDFVYKAMSERSVVLFNSGSVRTFLHINDGINAYLLVLENLKKMKGQIFNVGSNELNYSKLELANKIKKYVNFEIVNSSLSEKDQRSFIISYDKIGKLGYKYKKSLDSGIKELINLYKFYDPYSDSRPI